eukprot:TRINITY_DN1454_c0_g1_i1.p2 TRINITY_DN1454_c0_g1~~TRINITY_DN1454_c0_g1_i1.p2  ORF type:complete len:158 (+),score=20.12 TRINITY_DN1454_c0_g1_i1:811-1284(+)
MIKATFSGNLVGVISFSQDINDATSPAIMFLKLVSNASYMSNVSQYDWYFSNGTTDLVNCQTNIVSRASNLGCQTDKQEQCQPTDLMGKTWETNSPKIKEPGSPISTLTCRLFKIIQSLSWVQNGAGISCASLVKKMSVISSKNVCRSSETAKAHRG